MSNPVIQKYASFDNKHNGYQPIEIRDHLKTDRAITLDDVLVKTLILFAVLIPVAGIAYFLTPPALMGTALLGSLAATLVLGVIIALKRKVSVPLIFAYVVLKGVFAGVLSASYNYMFDGIVTTALVSTAITAVVVIGGVKMGILRTSSRARQIFGYLMIGYFVFSLVALGAALLGFGFLHFGSPLLLAVAVFGVGMAVFCFVTDVEDVKHAVSTGLPASEDWRLAFGITVSLVWLYLEILRLIAAVRSMVE